MRKIVFLTIAAVMILTGCRKKDRPGDDPVLNPTLPTSYVDFSKTHQTIRGFGGTTAWISPLTQTEATTLFGNANETQLGLSILRLRIAPEGSSRWGDELANAQKASALGALVIAAPWSPPVALKSNGNIIGGSLKPTSYSAYAQHLKSFADFLKSGGVDLYGISVQNEPDIKVSYESCDWTSEEMLNFVKNNSAEIGSTRLMVAESFNFNQAFTDPMLNDPVAAARISIIAGHIYGSGLARYQNALNKEKEVWMTEHLENNTSWEGALKTGKDIHDCMTVANYSAYVWWYLRRSYGPMDESSQPTKRGFVMAQFSKFIRNGYQRVTASPTGDADMYISAYKGGNKQIIVILNYGISPRTLQFSITGETPAASFTPYVTSAAKSLEKGSSIASNKGVLVADVPASSITTLVSN